jgi:epoxyqueuosine reductase QueG
VLIATPTDKPGPRAYICDECIAVCNSLLEDRFEPGLQGNTR